MRRRPRRRHRLPPPVPALPPRQLTRQEAEAQAQRIKQMTKFDGLPHVVRNALNTMSHPRNYGVGTARDKIVFEGQTPEQVASDIRHQDEALTRARQRD